MKALAAKPTAIAALRMLARHPVRSLTSRILACTLIGAFALAGKAFAQTNPESTQIAELYQLQAAFHRAATVHYPFDQNGNPTGDPADVITQRVRDMLSLFTANAVVYAPNGYYIGNGDPEDPSSCPEPSASAGEVLGTVCTFFKYVAPSFQKGSTLISLSPSYKTSFDVHGDTASGYYECHYYDVSTTPWTAGAKIRTYATFQNVNGHWLISAIKGTPGGIPIP